MIQLLKSNKRRHQNNRQQISQIKRTGFLSCKRYHRLLFVLSFFWAFTISGGAQLITISEELPIYNDASYEIIGELAGQTLLFGTK